MTPTPHNLDALLPAAMAEKAENVGITKANMSFWPLFVLAVLAGAFIGLGAIFATTVTTGASGGLTFGVTKLLGGFVFSLGLILVIVAGAELFTGNNLIVMAWASGKVSTGRLLRNWAIVYLGNFVGSILTAMGMFLSGQYSAANGELGRNALSIAEAKLNLGFVQAIMLGIFCNALVCLAVWLCLSSRTTTDKILAIVFPITAFVAAGFEHSIANMYFVPVALFIKAGANHPFWGNGLELVTGSYADLTWVNFIVANLIPVTIGNIIGGAGMVGLVYWFVFLRTRQES